MGGPRWMPTRGSATSPQSRSGATRPVGARGHSTSGTTGDESPRGELTGRPYVTIDGPLSVAAQSETRTRADVVPRTVSQVPTIDTAPTLRSLPTTDGVADLVRRRYDLDVARCVLVRSFVNEVYEVRTSERRFVLKLYRHDGWTVEEVIWEAELVDHLVANAIPAAPVVSMTSGGAVGQLAAPEGLRPFLLSEYVEGRKPQKPFDDDLYRAYGRLLARLHEAGDTFRTDRYGAHSA